jgi:hypothetical protein
LHRQLLCPKCHQPIKHERLGVRLTALKAGILDAIRSAGDIGVSVDDLANTDLWRETGGPPTRETIKAHIFQINQSLDGTGYRIVGERPSAKAYGFAAGERPAWRWSLVRRKARAA